MVAARTPNLVAAAAGSHRKPAGVGAESRSRKRLSWEAKLRPELQPSVVADKRNGQRLLLPTPLLVAETIASVPRGHVITLSCLREQLARRFNAESTCPLMTGIFAGILAGVVADDLAAHRKPRWPVWRLVRDDGTLNPKWPLDVLYRASLLRDEGVRLTRRRGTWAALDPQHC